MIVPENTPAIHATTTHDHTIPAVTREDLADYAAWSAELEARQLGELDSLFEQGYHSTLSHPNAEPPDYLRGTGLEAWREGSEAALAELMFEALTA